MADLKCQPVEVGYLRQLAVTVLSVSCVAGVLGNGLVLWMAVFRMPRTVTMVWFFNLALADFTVLLSVPISIYIIVHGWWPSPNLVCKLYMAFLVLTFFVSIYLLVLISVDRCILVLYPVWARNHRTVQRATWLSIAVWLLAAAACSPYLKYRTAGKLHGCEYCYFDFSSDKESGQDRSATVARRQAAIAITHFLLGFLVPLTVISICAHCIRSRLRMESTVHARQSKRLLVVVVSAFFIFWFPFNMVLLVKAALLTSPQQPHYPTMELISWAAFALGCLNSCLNPFLYVFLGRDFQQKILQSLSSALPRVFGEEGFISHPVPEANTPAEGGNLTVQTRSPPS
ncbi:Formyl peptide receptor 2 [Apodemus speciosus]|uniref:Formyl peptide receptor 2 n=1 Tax=Apodemus speciosus TaxID=105296 RepID=A0ABQ0EYA1_APOSI